MGHLAIVQTMPSGIFEMAFTIAIVAGAILLIGAMGSLAVFGYRSVRGEGTRDPAEVVPEKVDDEENGVTKADPDDEWDYY